MNIEQIYTGCLAQGAYYIESNGESCVIDPLREVRVYQEKAEESGANIKYVFETHFHADFVSGHLTLAERTGAQIVFGPGAKTDFESVNARDNQEFKLGDVTIVALHTPGHTLESTSYLLRDSEDKDVALFSGDTLFLGDVGRPDLAQKGDLTQEDLAGMLYDSLRTKIMPLADDVLVYPAHGAGSACGKNMMKETVDTLGNQKTMNYALRSNMTKEEFVNEVLDGLEEPPSYFPLNVELNKKGYTDVKEVLTKGDAAYGPEEFKEVAIQSEALILDIRKAGEFAEGHIPGSIFIGLDGGFAPWVGELIGDVTQPILLVCDSDRVEEAVTRLARVGFDQTLGFLEGGIEAWKKAGFEVDTVENITASSFASLLEKQPLKTADVRKPGEYDADHLEDVPNITLSRINDHLRFFEGEETTYVHCAGGYRSMIAISILKARGYHDLVNIVGGYKSLADTKLQRVTSTCGA